MKGADGLTRTPSSTERERLHGFPAHHTLCLVSSSQAKSQATKVEALRRGLLGNTFHCVTVAWLVGQWGVACGFLDTAPSLNDLMDRSRREQEGTEQRDLDDNFDDGQLMVSMLSRHADHKGSDVRLSTGEVFRPCIWPRQGINPGWWQWKVVVAYKWNWKEHINPLEGRAILSMLKWRLRNHRKLATRFLHLGDSQVNIGVMTKHRSSSHQMNLIARKISALELASFCHPLHGFTRSEFNPADAPSRW